MSKKKVEGYTDRNGNFHPIRNSEGYNEKKAGENYDVTERNTFKASGLRKRLKKAAKGFLFGT